MQSAVTPGTGQGIPDGEIRSALEGVIADAEVSGERRSLMDILWERLADMLPEELEAGTADTFQWTILCVAGILVAFIIVRMVQAAADSRVIPSGSSTTSTDIARRERALEVLARARAASNDPALAARLYLFALILGLGERGDLVYREAWTYRELLDQGGPKPRVEALLRPLVAELESVAFGGRAPSPDQLKRLEVLARVHLERSIKDPEEAA